MSKLIQDEHKKFINFEINIIDTGAGISEEGQQKLFLNFSKLAENADINKDGTGLGLSICRQIIE
jgi:K+-sensing histidine kinase KdpD